MIIPNHPAVQAVKNSVTPRSGAVRDSVARSLQPMSNSLVIGAQERRRVRHPRRVATI